jgi:hypothetical protein
MATAVPKLLLGDLGVAVGLGSGGTDRKAKNKTMKG